MIYSRASRSNTTYARSMGVPTRLPSPKRFDLCLGKKFVVVKYGVFLILLSLLKFLCDTIQEMTPSRCRTKFGNKNVITRSCSPGTNKSPEFGTTVPSALSAGVSIAAKGVESFEFMSQSLITFLSAESTFPPLKNFTV